MANKVGRPTVMTNDIVNKLEEAFCKGATDLQACFYAGISKQTLYNYQDLNPDFVDRKEALKSNVNFIAKNVIYDKLMENDKDIAKWQLERGEKENYSIKETKELIGDKDKPITFDVNISPDEAYRRMIEES